MRPHIDSDLVSEPRGPASGFTLIELMFVIIVLSVGILAGVKLLPLASREQLRDRMRTAGSYYAQQQVETLRGLGYNDQKMQDGRYPGPTGTETVGVNGAYHRYYTVTSLTDPLPNSKRISVVVRWTTVMGDDSVAVTTYVGR